VTGTESAPTPILGPKRAIVVFVLFFLMQFMAGILVGIVIGFAFAVRYGGGPEVSAAIQRAVVIPAAIVGEITGGAVVLRMARRSLPGSVGSGALQPLGWARASLRETGVASLVGLAVAIGYVVLAARFPPSSGWILGPVAAAGTSHGWRRHAWAGLALVVAPPIEEFVFRGVLLTGFRRTWRLATAGTVVSVLFMASHLWEIGTYGPAVTAVTLLCVGTLVARVVTASLVPAVALHAAYNLGLVATVYLSGG
jgi:membrane protease YdiL (CAAX protease family)